MKLINYFAAVIVMVTLNAARGQTNAPGPNAATQRAADGGLTRFTLDFEGGTPKQLVAAIQKAMGRPLNAIIPEEFVNVRLPELKMNHVTVRELFSALESASLKTEAYVSSTYYGGGYAGGPSQSYQIAKTSYGFRTVGTLTDDSVWYFSMEKPAFPPISQPPPKVCRFYSLAPYLERGQTVDDITTAIQTGWKMLGDKSVPAINFHKDTKLLIAVGEESKLATIDAVLKALQPIAAPAPLPPVPPLPAVAPKPPKKSN